VLEIFSSRRGQVITYSHCCGVVFNIPQAGASVTLVQLTDCHEQKVLALAGVSWLIANAALRNQGVTLE